MEHARMSTSSFPAVAFFGLGTMGTGMARRLLGAGVPLTVYNRSPGRAEALAAEGARVARTPREAAAGARVLITMVADDPASRAMWLGEEGALAGAQAGATALDCSTLTVKWVRELAAAAAAKGVTFLDAPVAGSKPQAAAGELVFFVGGDKGALDGVGPVLAPMAKRVVHLGPTGAGATVKLVNNFMSAVEAVALAEGNALLRRAGIDVAAALPLLTEGTPGSPMIRTMAARHASGDPTVNFSLKLMAKDLRYAIGEGEAAGVPLTTAAAALATMQAAMDANLGDRDLSTVVRFVQER
jgi:3-hydroxyisobutyrate dehydrogenase